MLGQQGAVAAVLLRLLRKCCCLAERVCCLGEAAGLVASAWHTADCWAFADRHIAGAWPPQALLEGAAASAICCAGPEFACGCGMREWDTVGSV